MRVGWADVVHPSITARRIAPHHKHEATQYTTTQHTTKEYATNVAALVDSKLEKAKNYVEQVWTDWMDVLIRHVRCVRIMGGI